MAGIAPGTLRVEKTIEILLARGETLAVFELDGADAAGRLEGAYLGRDEIAVGAAGTRYFVLQLDFELATHCHPRPAFRWS